MRTHIVYIPGLGGSYNKFRRIALKFWRIYGVSAELVLIDWYDGKSFDQNMNQVKQAVAKGNAYGKVVVIGESAGATLALHAAALPGVSRVITLCGVAQSNTPISPYLQKKSSALVQATRSIPDTTPYDVHSIYAVIDSVVGSKYSIATGAKSYKYWLTGHLFAIIICLTFLAPLMLTIAKKSKT